MIGPKLNYAALLIWLALALLAAGVEVGGNLQPSRIVIMAATVILLLRGRLLKDATRPTQFFVFVAYVWLSWGVTSLLWTPDFTSGVTEILVLCLGFLTVVAFINLARETTSALEMIRLGWVTAFLLTVPIAIYEIVTDQHLPSSYGQLTSGGLESVPVLYAAATFGNRNTYVAFIVMALPFALWGFHASWSLWRKAFYLATAFCAAGLVLVDGSRLGTAATGIELLAWLLLTFDLRRFRSLLTVALCVAALTLGAIQITNVSSLAQIRIVNFAGNEDQSVILRNALYEDGLRLLIRSGGIGVGAGGFQQSIANGSDLAFTAGLVDPHNLFLEVLSQYGLIVGGLFFAWLAYCFAIVFSGIRQQRLAAWRELELAAKHSIILILAWPIVFLVNSAFLRYTILWMAIACVASVAGLVVATVPLPVQTTTDPR